MSDATSDRNDHGISAMWRDVDSNAAATARYLDLLTSLVDGIKRRATETLRLVPGQRVLEIGCGTGRDAELLAQMVAPGGEAVATDLSATLIAQATARVAELGLPLTYQVADAQNLPFPDDSFDAARAERMLQHLPDPARAVREMVRVVRPGGRVVAFEPDWETVVASGAPAVAVRALRRHRMEAATANGGIGRDTPHYFQLAGCRDIVAEGVVFFTQSLETADTVLSLRSCLEGAVKSGHVSQADADAWLADATARDQTGSFFASLNGTIVSAVVGGT